MKSGAPIPNLPRYAEEGESVEAVFLRGAKAVFPRSNHGENFSSIQPATGASFRGLFHSLLMAPQERVHIPLSPYVRGHRCLIPRASSATFFEVCARLRVVRLDGQTKEQIAHRVLVRAVH